MSGIYFEGCPHLSKIPFKIAVFLSLNMAMLLAAILPFDYFQWDQRDY